jgi:hypothetical protein
MPAIHEVARRTCGPAPTSAPTASPPRSRAADHALLRLPTGPSRFHRSNRPWCRARRRRGSSADRGGGHRWRGPRSCAAEDGFRDAVETERVRPARRLGGTARACRGAGRPRRRP